MARIILVALQPASFQVSRLQIQIVTAKKSLNCTNCSSSYFWARVLLAPPKISRVIKSKCNNTLVPASINFQKSLIPAKVAALHVSRSTFFPSTSKLL